MKEMLDGMTLTQLAHELGMQASHVSHYIRLLRLPALISDGYYSKTVSLTHLFIISRLKSVESMQDIYEQVLTSSLSVNQTEELVRETLYDITPDGERLTTPKMVKIQEKLMKKLPANSKCKIVQTRIRAKVTIEIPGNAQTTSAALRHFVYGATRGKKEDQSEVGIVDKSSRREGEIA